MNLMSKPTLSKKTRVALLAFAIIGGFMLAPIVTVNGQTQPIAVPSQACSATQTLHSFEVLTLGSLNATIQSKDITITMNLTGISTNSITGTYHLGSLTVMGLNTTNGRTVLSLKSGSATLSIGGNATYQIIGFSLASLTYYLAPSLAQQANFPLTQLSLSGLSGTLYLNCQNNTASTNYTASMSVASIIQSYIGSKN